MSTKYYLTKPINLKEVNIRALASKDYLVLVLTNPEDTDRYSKFSNAVKYDLDKAEEIISYTKNSLNEKGIKLDNDEIQLLLDDLRAIVTNEETVVTDGFSKEFNKILAYARAKIDNEYSKSKDKTNDNLTGAINNSMTSLMDFLIENYNKELYELANTEEKELVIDYQLLFNHYDENINNFSEKLILTPETQINFIERAVKGLNPYFRDLDINVRFRNLDITPLKEADSNKIGNLIQVKGVVKGLGLHQTKINTAVYECNGCMRYHTVKQNMNNNKLISPSMCSECGGRSFRLVEEESKYTDVRELILEEATEDLTNNSNPRRIKVQLLNDLIYKVNTGDRVNVTGVLTAVKSNKKEDNGLLNFLIRANHIENAEEEEIIITNEDRERIKAIAERPDNLKLLTNSVTRFSIDYEVILSLLCAIVRGVKELDIATGELTLRDAINILIVTPPAFGKTKLIKRILKLSERSLLVNGAMSSGVGLVGAVVKDTITGNPMIELGALPLANGGLVGLDEFDKLDLEESKKLLQVLEDGEDTIAKAGIVEKIKADTGVIGLCNPKYGDFDTYKSIKDQVKVYPPLLSRQDLTFVIEEKPDTAKAINNANIILGIEEATEETEVIDNDLLKKYLTEARNLNPIMNKDEKLFLRDYYMKSRDKTREEDNDILIKIDNRTLASLKRLSYAIAKLNLHNEVTRDDCIEAIRLKNYSLKSAGLDPNTGEVDIARVMGTSDLTEKNNRNLILKVIKDWIEDTDNLDYEYIYKSKLKQLMTTEHNMGKSTFYNVFKQLKNNGDIIEDKDKIYLAEKH